MSTLEQLTAWKIRKWMPWTGSWYPSKPATPESVAHLEEVLKFKIPTDFIEFSWLTHNYGVWFGSIGDDYGSHNHLLTLNAAFHKAGGCGVALPQHWVLINHGHNGDCDCFDITASEGGEYPIYYMNVESPGAPKLLAKTFKEYLVRLG
jgi:hypothetical protein